MGQTQALCMCVCFITAIKIKLRKVCCIYVAMRTRKYLFESCFRHFSEKQLASSYCSYKVDQINTFTTNIVELIFLVFILFCTYFKLINQFLLRAHFCSLLTHILGPIEYIMYYFTLKVYSHSTNIY